jgi:hypothetical protein
MWCLFYCSVQQQHGHGHHNHKPHGSRSKGQRYSKAFAESYNAQPNNNKITTKHLYIAAVNATITIMIILAFRSIRVCGFKFEQQYKKYMFHEKLDSN